MMTQMSSLALSGKMKPVMRTSRLYRFVVLLSALGCVFSFAGTGFSQPARGEDKDRSRELSREQEQIRAIVLKLADDMDKVAEKLEASEPQDAERLRAGARQIRTQRLPDTLAQIEGMLSNKDFISAVSRQNEAIKIIDDILAVLEASQFTESRAGQQLEKLKEQRKLTGKLKQEQERLLDETRKFLSEKEAAEGLQDLTDLISEVLKMQEGLVKGDSIPRGGGKTGRLSTRRSRLLEICRAFRNGSTMAWPSCPGGRSVRKTRGRLPMPGRRSRISMSSFARPAPWRGIQGSWTGSRQNWAG